MPTCLPLRRSTHQCRTASMAGRRTVWAATTFAASTLRCLPRAAWTGWWPALTFLYLPAFSHHAIPSTACLHRLPTPRTDGPVAGYLHWVLGWTLVLYHYLYRTSRGSPAPGNHLCLPTWRTGCDGEVGHDGGMVLHTPYYYRLFNDACAVTPVTTAVHTSPPASPPPHLRLLPPASHRAAGREGGGRWAGQPLRLPLPTCRHLEPWRFSPTSSILAIYAPLPHAYWRRCCPSTSYYREEEMEAGGEGRLKPW